MLCAKCDCFSSSCEVRAPFVSYMFHKDVPGMHVLHVMRVRAFTSCCLHAIHQPVRARREVAVARAYACAAREVQRCYRGHLGRKAALRRKQWRSTPAGMSNSCTTCAHLQLCTCVLRLVSLWQTDLWLGADMRAHLHCRAAVFVLPRLTLATTVISCDRLQVLHASNLD